MLINDDIKSIETYSFGISGLDTKIMTLIKPDMGVLMAPMDPWFIFSPVALPSLSTEWVRQFNLIPSNLRWFYWLPFDKPYNIFEWFPKWDSNLKKYNPLNSSNYPIKLPSRHIPMWVSNSTDLFKEWYKDELDQPYLPPAVN